MSGERSSGCERAIAQLLEGQRPAEHLSRCSACLSFANRLALVDEALRDGDPEAGPAPRLAEPVLRYIVERESKRLRRRMFGVAAMLVVSLGMAVWSVSRLAGSISTGFSGLAPVAGQWWRRSVQSGAQLVASVSSLESPMPLDLILIMAVLTVGMATLLMRRLAVDS